IGAVGALAAAAVNKKLNMPVVTEAARETLKVTSMLMWVFLASLLFSAVFDGLGATYAVEGFLNILGGGPLGTIVVMQLSFFLLGMVMDDAAMLLNVAPLYIPMVANMGYSLVWYGVLYTVNMQMAMLTPPFGYNLFLMKGIIPSVAPKSGITMADIYRSIIPFVAIQAAALGIIIAFPQIALWLPSVMFGS
ncbi:MAG: TRAP transporter large permease subunit, partial [Dehalococcoidia bacterium]